MASPVADNIYFHVNQSNPVNAQDDIAGRLTLSREISYINNPDDYYLRIVYADISAETIPFFILYPNTYAFIMSGDNGIQFIEYWGNQPLDPFNPSFYFYINQVLLEANRVLSVLMQRVNTSNGTAYIAPLMVYDFVGEGRFKIVFDYNTFVGNGMNQHVTLYMNNIAFQRFIGFYNSFVISPLYGNLAQILMVDTGINNFPTGVSPTLLYHSLVMTYGVQGYVDLIALKGIIFITNTLPINNEYLNLSGVNVIGFHSTTSGNNSNNFRPLLLEIPIPTPGNDLSNKITFSNTEAYPTLIDIGSNTPLNQIDIDIYLVDAFDNRIPYTLAPGGHISVKFAFTKKSMFNLDKSKLLRQIEENTR